MWELARCPKRGRDRGDHEGLLSGDQSEEDHQAFWNPEQGEGDQLEGDLFGYCEPAAPPINIEDEPAVPLPIPQSGCMLHRGRAGQ